MGPLREIDPLTFIGYFNRQTATKTRVSLCAAAKDKLGLSTTSPTDFTAIPRLNNHNVWFFGYEKDWKDDDIDNLWRFAVYSFLMNLAGLPAHISTTSGS